MASFVAAPRATVVPISLPFSRSDDAFCKVVFPRSVPLKRRGLNVSMGVVKFKGTQQREKQLTEMIEKKVLEAKEVCEGDAASDECRVAWDEVEEVSQAKADLRLKLEKEDPLESYCNENPETDECRIYED
ncbi:calvin cycle protein CP12-3 chloroplastic [Tripterygium wilfordii]|uniref:Calvin cycle protein CP12-3 chloroplastic n=1 Tax=Tripterygium wilfordii TaxID=458696 RepID=A0A7J7D3R1_TRIWF|nr:calvin cycle protein CP12-3, chloroplastic [Tripterygium wilfordii]KAF5740994.1 calvin cycle protein CP12-3 chloroplastic [Tripterygium wilfordii]